MALWKLMIAIGMLPGLLPLAAAAEMMSRPDLNGSFELQSLAFAELQDATRDGRRIKIKVHLPVAEGRWPVVVVSHGGGGHWDGHYAQARHLASHGFAVLCLEHPGSNTARLRAAGGTYANLIAMTRDATEVLGRPADASFALDRAAEWNLQHPQLKGRLDLGRAGILGHSYGAYTTLAACGARPALEWLEPRPAPGLGLGPDLSDARFRAGVALSPQGPGEPYFLPGSYASLKRPVLGITGSQDRQQGAPPENRRRFFELIPPGGHILIWIEGVDHLAFSDGTGSGQPLLPSATRADAQPLVRAATLLFFDAHLRGRPEALNAITAEALKPLLGPQLTALEIHKK